MKSHSILFVHNRTSEIVDFSTNTTSEVYLNGLKYPIVNPCAVFHDGTVYIIGGHGDFNYGASDDEELDVRSHKKVYAYTEEIVNGKKTGKWNQKTSGVEPLTTGRHSMACGFWKEDATKPKIVAAGGIRYKN